MSRILATILLLTSVSSFASLNKKNFEKAKSCLGKKESNNDYKAVNTLGYIGRYQFGAQALEDIGYLNKGCYKKHRNGVPKSCWRGVYNTHSRVDYLNSPKAQDESLRRLFDLNYKRLKRNKTLTKKDSQVKIGRALFVAHLLGASAAKKYFKNNINNKDAYGTRASDYDKVAQRCFK